MTHRTYLHIHIAFGKHLLDCLAHVILGDLQILLGRRVIVHECAEALAVDVNEVVVLAHHLGHLDIVRRRADVLILLAREDVNADQIDLQVYSLNDASIVHTFA